jgi:hypothetical protein
MRLIFTLALTITLSTKLLATYIDTIDVWTVRPNGKPIINSNQTSIMFDHPMIVNLSSFNDTDSLEICYWTDHGSQTQRWHYIRGKTDKESLFQKINKSKTATCVWTLTLNPGFTTY